MSVRNTRSADLYLRRNYHLTLDEYNKVLQHQGGKCAICKRRPATGRPRLAVDHCHTTGLLRGLCCWHCNRAIAVFHDDVVRLRAAVAYLTHPPITAVFGPRYTAPGRIGTKKRTKLLRAMQPNPLRSK